MRVGNKECVDRVLFTRRHADDALATAVLLTIGCKWLALDVAAPANGDHHIFVGNEVFVGHLARRIVGDARATQVAKLLFHLGVLAGDDLRDARRSAQDIFEFGDQLDHFEVLVFDLLALKRRKSSQTHVEDRLRLKFAELELLHQLHTRDVNVGGSTNGLDDRIKVVECDL